MTQKKTAKRNHKGGTGLATNGLAAHIRMAAKYGPADADTPLILTVANEIGENGLDPIEAWREVLAEEFPEIYGSADSDSIPWEMKAEVRSA